MKPARRRRETRHRSTSGARVSRRRSTAHVRPEGYCARPRRRRGAAGRRGARRCRQARSDPARLRRDACGPGRFEPVDEVRAHQTTFPSGGRTFSILARCGSRNGAEVLLRHELRHDRLPRRRNERRACAGEEREYKQCERRGLTGRDKKRKSSRADCRRNLNAEKKVPPVYNVRQSARAAQTETLAGWSQLERGTPLTGRG